MESECASLMDATALPPDTTRSSFPAEFEMEVEGAQGADEPGTAAAGCPDVREQGCSGEREQACPGVREQACQADLRTTRCCAEAEELGDPPLVQQQLHTSRHGVQQILECLRVGTPRLKHLLLCEVDIIFECQLCRSLFRGLPNLIMHRQNYCHPYAHTCTEDDSFFEEDNNNIHHSRDVLPEPSRPQDKRVDFIIKLDPIATNRNAVFQHVITSDDPEWGAHTAAAELPRQGPSGVAPVGPTEAKEAGPEPKTSPVKAETTAARSVLSDFSLGYSCNVCKKSFQLRRSVRRHIRVVHKKLAEEVNRYFCLDGSEAGVAAALARAQSAAPHDRKACPVCQKSFANKANVRRHFHDTHADVKWEVAWKESRSASRPRASPRSLATPWSLAPVKILAPAKRRGGAAAAEILVWICPMCNRKHGSLIAIKRHLQLFHKQNNFMMEGDEEAKPPADAPTEHAGPADVVIAGGGGNRLDDSTVADVLESQAKPPEQRETPTKAGVKDRDPKAHLTPDKATHKENLCTVCGHAFPSRVEYRKHMSTSHACDLKPEQNGIQQPAEPETPTKSGGGGIGGGGERQQSPRRTAQQPSPPLPPPENKGKGKLFDLRQLYCRLCKRRFSTRQNLRKHIEMHTDGDRLYVKFFRCPLCAYESRRKSDILRHLTVVHKHSSCYLRRVATSLDSRSIKKPVDAFLNRKIRRGRLPHGAALRVKAEPGNGAAGGEDGGESSVAPAEDASATTVAAVTAAVAVTAAAAAATTPTASPVKAKAPVTPPAAQPPSPGLPYRCDECGKAYAKKSYLDNHKLVHVRRGRAAGRQGVAAAAAARSKRSSFPCRNTRSRSVKLCERRRQQQPPAK